MLINIEYLPHLLIQTTQVVEQLQLGRINISELTRQELAEKLRETLADEERIILHSGSKAEAQPFTAVSYP